VARSATTSDPDPMSHATQGWTSAPRRTWTGRQQTADQERYERATEHQRGQRQASQQGPGSLMFSPMNTGNRRPAHVTPAMIRGCQQVEDRLSETVWSLPTSEPLARSGSKIDGGNVVSAMKTVKGQLPQRPSRRERARATQWRMIKAAYRRFCDQGYAGTTMAQIADDAGVAFRRCACVPGVGSSAAPSTSPCSARTGRSA
jgi:hypothetical protein